DAGVPFQFAEQLAVGDVPEANRLILTGRGQRIAIRTEGDAVDRAGVSGESADFLAAGEVPEFDRVIEAGRHQQLAVRTERTAVDQGGVALQLGRPLCSGEDGYSQQEDQNGPRTAYTACGRGLAREEKQEKEAE